MVAPQGWTRVPGVAQAVLEREVLDTVRAVFEERMVVMFYLDDGTMGTLW